MIIPPPGGPGQVSSPAAVTGYIGQQAVATGVRAAAAAVTCRQLWRYCQNARRMNVMVSGQPSCNGPGAIRRGMTAELVYFGLRLVLAAASATAALAYLRYAWLARRTWWLWPSVGGGFLCVTTGLSLYDGIDNFSLRPHDPISVTSWLWLLFVDLPMPILAILLGGVRRQRDHLVAELSRLSVSDQLTGLLNRRGFVERAVLAIAQARRSGIALAVLMLDIDHFKAVHDGYGHAAGDTVLRSLATTMSDDRRSGDLVCRLGGEEFAVLLYATTAEEAFNVAERLRAEVKRRVPHPGGSDHQVD